MRSKHILRIDLSVFFCYGRGVLDVFYRSETAGRKPRLACVFLKPPIAMLFVWWLLKEQPQASFLIGIVLVLIGLLLVTRRTVGSTVLKSMEKPL